jgi:hypothetical protein
MHTLFLVIAVGSIGAAPPTPARAEARAVAFLAREVPRWFRKNRCYSCHNNGDAVRALVAALRRGHRVPASALADSTRWLSHPAGWDRNGGEGPFNDRKLARLQFSAALADVHEAGLVKGAGAMMQAARLVAELQDRDGSWRVVPAGTLASPATHGTALATHLARRTLQRASGVRFKEPIARADAWLRQAPVDSLPDAAAILLALGKAGDARAAAQRRRCLDRVRKADSKGGGWGPYVGSAPEVFDTAVVLLALADLEQTAEAKAWSQRGRAYLLATQEKDGSWPETTRPSGADSYAQRLSTAGWATLALLTTRRQGR